MFYHHFENGLVLLAEPMSWAESASYSMLIPYGPIFDSPELDGLASLCCEMLLRGAGNRNSREFLEAVENLGCETTESVAFSHTEFAASVIADNLLASLDLLADQILRPQMPESQLNAAKQVLKQDIYSLEDDPARWVSMELQRNFLPDPWGRAGLGTIETIDRITIDALRSQHARYYQPNGTILSVAGKFDWSDLRKKIEHLFADWQPQSYVLPKEKKIGSPLVHIPSDSAQTHIGLAFPSIPLGAPNYMLARSSIAALSGGMSSRLFNEMREKRGLCYHVSASYFTLREHAGVYCYCATEREQESLDVLITEINRLKLGIDQDELDRLKIRAKCSLIMQQESSASRSAVNARDWYHLGRIRSHEELESDVNRLTRKDINQYLASHPPGPFHLVTLGKKVLVRNT